MSKIGEYKKMLLEQNMLTKYVNEYEIIYMK